MDWAQFWGATTAAATLATAISTGAVLWLRRRERPVAEWVVVAVHVRWARDRYNSDADLDLIEITGTICNAGDGAAFGVAVSGREATAGLRGGRTIAAYCPPGADVEFFCNAKSYNWRSAAIAVSWTPPPTRLKQQRVQSIAVMEFAGANVPDPPWPPPGEVEAERTSPRT